VLAFAVSPVPLVREFAFFMAIGVAMSFLASLLVGLPALVLLARRYPPAGEPDSSPPPPSWERLARLGRLPRPVVLPLTVAGLIGWAALPMMHLETDPSRLLPSNAHALQQAEHVRQAVGVVGELDLVVTGPDVSSPALVAWLAGAEGRIADKDLNPITGLPQFLTTFNYGQPPDAAATRVILGKLPAYLTQAVASPDHHLARVAFGQSKLTSVQEDRALVARMDRAGQPPAGYQAYPAGLSVLAASALDRLSADQLRLTLLAVGLVVVVLIAAYRSLLPALLAVMPTVVGAGWVTGLMFLGGARATPITVLLSGVVIAFATEFSVLWLARYRAERSRGTDAGEAADVASRRVGPAIVASSVALVAGLAALAVSPVPMVRDFGLLSAGDLALATAAVLVLLPPAARGWLR
jgi:predicted RND superfamily exporter protein